MEKDQNSFYAESEGVHISLKQYDYLKSIERDVDKIKDDFASEKTEIGVCFIKFILNIKNIIPHSQIEEAITKAGYSIWVDNSHGENTILGSGSKKIKIKQTNNL